MSYNSWSLWLSGGTPKALLLEEDRDEEERQREEAEQALAGPVQVDVVRAARLRRLATPTTSDGEIPLPPIPEGGGGNS